LKLNKTLAEKMGVLSPLTQGRGLKRPYRVGNGVGIRSPLTQGRGLKQIGDVLKKNGKRRPSRRGVD
tara:strand:- start:5585 stop:5785 length:201 start_codon:yes stop_codon:yes gene_type:complete